jgi:polysaccharide pyruvyl transferase WcaK-like protein
MKPVVLVNHWHDDNRGDSAITYGTLMLLDKAWPDRPLVLHILNTDAEYHLHATRHVRRAFPKVTTRPSLVPTPPASGARLSTLVWFARTCWLALRLAADRPPAELADLRDAHAVCLLGGSNLFVQGRQRAMGLARLLQLLAPAIVAQRRGVPTYLLGHTIGPLRGRSARRLARSVLRRATLITVREQHSAALLAGFGVSRAKYRVAPDLAFGLTPSKAESEAVLERYGLKGVRFLALSVRQHPYDGTDATDRLAAEVEEFARRALRERLVDRIAVVAQALGPTPVEDDRGISRRLAVAIGNGAIFVEEDLSPTELTGIYAGAAAVVAVRLHAAILSMAGGVPAMAISYFTSKTEGVFEFMGMPDMWCEFADVTAGMLLNRLGAMLDQAYGAMVSSRAAEARHDVLEIAHELP